MSILSSESVKFDPTRQEGCCQFLIVALYFEFLKHHQTLISKSGYFREKDEMWNDEHFVGINYKSWFY